MKSGEIKKIVQCYARFLRAPWQQTGNLFARHEGDWVHIVGFNTSRWADKYVPCSSLDFLKLPGAQIGGLLPQELHHPNGTQRWVNSAKLLVAESRDSASKVFEAMSNQFKPSLFSPLSLAEIKRLLSASLNYWPHAYALCVMACEEGDVQGKERYFNAFMAAVADKPFPWAEARKQEVADYMKLDPTALKARLDRLKAEKLKALKLQ